MTPQLVWQCLTEAPIAIQETFKTPDHPSPTNPTSCKEDTKSFAPENTIERPTINPTDPLTGTTPMEGALLQAKIETEVSLTPVVDLTTEALPPKRLDHPPTPSTKTRTDVSVVTNMDILHVTALKEENPWQNS